ncbi:MAG: hypothetical protein U5J83_03900 [Bryobacterales bacterium]|nr:hypothetical protein [Bryobacterales bacterium]
MSLRLGFARPRAFLFLFVALFGTLQALAQTSPPMNLSTLKQVLAIGEDVLSTNDVIARVKKEGVDFFLDADMKTELILAAAEGRRTETDTLKIIDSLADACLPCKERMEAPISTELALRFLSEKVRSKDILSEIKKRGLAQENITLENIVALREAGASEAMLRIMKPDATPVPPDGFTVIEPAKGKAFDANRPYGIFDVRARVDETVEFRVLGDKIYFKTIAGSPAVNQASEISGVLPRVPTDAVSFTLRQKDGRTKGATGEALPADGYGFPAYQFSVNDEKSRDDRYHYEVAWQLKPFTLATLKPEVEELSGSFPELLISDIRLRGFSSALQPEEEEALRLAGATYEILNAIRGSIRIANNPPR